MLQSAIDTVWVWAIVLKSAIDTVWLWVIISESVIYSVHFWAILSELVIDCSFRFLYWDGSVTIFLYSTHLLDLDKVGTFCAGDPKCPFFVDVLPENKMLHASCHRVETFPFFLSNL